MAGDARATCCSRSASLLLLFEVIKGARPGAKYLTDHLLSLIVFGAAAAEFVLLPKFGNSTFFLLTLLALVDFLSGIALRARRGAPSRHRRRGVRARAPRKAEPPVAEPHGRAEPAPSRRSRPRASVPPDHPRADAAHTPPSAPNRRRRKSRRRAMQPGNGAQPSPDTPPRMAVVLVRCA